MSEVLGLTPAPDCVDYENNEITIKRVSQYLPRTGVFTKQPKTAKSRRTVSLPPEVMELISQCETERKKQKFLLGTKWQGSDKLFTTPDGADMHPLTLAY